ncbi:MAG: SDR family NAD(P)-dependent oxidoreductase [Acidimicrobiia bacterium]
MKRFHGQIAVVTGASSGIGRRLAVDLVDRGAVVVGLARRAALLDTLRAELQPTSPASDTQVCDVADTTAFGALLGELEDRFGRIDILINDAGVHERTPVLDGASVDAHERLMATNYFGVVAGTLAVLPGMVRRGSGIVVNVSSDAVRVPEVGEGGYAASKAALSTFSESAAHEVAGRGVHVHVLYPAWVPTAMGRDGADGSPPPRPIRRSEGEVSNLVLERMGSTRLELNASRLPLLAVMSRVCTPRLHARAMRARAS